MSADDGNRGMNFPPVMVRARVWAATLVAAVFLSCEKSPFEPVGEGERVPIDVVIEGRTRADSASRYSFTGSPNQPYLIFLEALEGRVQVYVYDSTHGYPGYPAATVSAVAGGPWLEQNSSNTFGTLSGAVYTVSVWATPAGTTARFRFKVHAIETNPERVPNSFSFGDTVSGETIHPMFDLDWFSAHGVAGQEIVTVVEPSEPAGSGSVGLTVIDDSSKQLLGYVFADAGAANQLTTGRIRLPGSHEYRFAFGSVISNTYPRYRGAYRFWTYLIDRAPEHRAATIPFNTEIGNERIDRAGDVDEFTVVATAGTEFNAFVQGRGRIFQLEVARQGGEPFALATSQASDTGLFARATSRFRITQAGTHVVRLTGTNPYEVADTGAYRVYLYAIDPRPEGVPSTITPGDTVSGEDIGLPGDVDEFTFSGVAGEEFNVFLQGLNGSPETRLQVEVLNEIGTVLRQVESVGTDSSLLRQVTGRFPLPGSGTYRLRVTGLWQYGVGDYRGAYRLFLYRVDRRPESLPDTLAFGDSLSGEAIDLPGDVDEFRVTVPDTSGASLVADGPGARVDLENRATGVIAMTANSSTVGTVRLLPGAYTLRVDGDPGGWGSKVRGAYRAWLYRFGFDPEQVSDTFAIGDTVSSESIDPWGDVDEFHFYGLSSQHVNIMAQGLAPPSSGWFQFYVIPPPNTSHGLFIIAPTSTAALEDRQTRRVDLPATGWYTVQVSGTGGGHERGAYRFTVLPIDPGPEHVSATLSAGDAVTSEPIDAPGDWDEFTVVGTPGQTMSVVFEGTDGFVGPWVYLRVFDPATNDTLAWQPSQFHRIAGPFRIPASGQVKIAVSEPAGFHRICYDPTCGVFTFVGPYRFRLVSVNRAPEIAAATFTVGDTVRGETISPVGDIDEFTATGTPGEQLTLFSRLTTTSSLDSAIVVEAIDPASDASLAGSNTTILGSSHLFSVGTFTVPPSGTFIVRTRVYGEWGYGVGETSYEFSVKRRP